MSNRLNAFHMRFIYDITTQELGHFYASVHKTVRFFRLFGILLANLFQSTDSNAIYGDDVTVISCALSGIISQPHRAAFLLNCVNIPFQVNGQ